MCPCQHLGYTPLPFHARHASEAAILSSRPSYPDGVIPQADLHENGRLAGSEPACPNLSYLKTQSHHAATPNAKAGGHENAAIAGQLSPPPIPVVTIPIMK